MWDIVLEICGSDINETNFKITNKPKIEGITSVSSREGGNVTINGINLYSRAFDNSTNKLSGYRIQLVKYPLVSGIEYNVSGLVTLFGYNFGRDLNKISIVSGETQIKISNVNDSCLQFMTPKLLHGLHYLDITVGIPDHQNIQKQYEFAVKPVILKINSIPVSGGEVTIYGNYLSPRAAISFRSKRGTPSGIPCNNITIYEDNTILKCNVKGISGQEIKLDGIGERKTTSGHNNNIFMRIKGRNAINPNNITFSFYPPTVYGSPGKSDNL
ncbi:hypothetical protein DICPUDRAFT_83123 [Dictyostelium purpureum]|uniref:IPT/TIG domain-containing protein n=1 Tax=Dictyostelium purpureum TaxID=5786 RepID=F0ZYL6_DICPU|nr:uncharacterized protein DICPUDRAFT_83123 [Dictyostelium purpureum]EGC30957.1 hypothetical protein DICPUDRAFT_83123 [Dictyostelium purpureum]|eukprot:XP_003292508.1 hypothetical protein DICPUDRAFT_83123 [Dictyostelium purpureum]